MAILLAEAASQKLAGLKILAKRRSGRLAPLIGNVVRDAEHQLNLTG
jgi:hypothetical protein